MIEFGPLVEHVFDDMIDVRRDLHRHPELSNAEHRTSAVITERLASAGWDVQRCPTSTGAVALLETGRPGRTVMVRADIDALPLREERSEPFRSMRDDAMHACGRDVHTAGVLGVAQLLAQRHDELCGRFMVVFQPAEEGFGGAQAMIDGGLFAAVRPDAIIGAHVTSLGPVGLVASRPGIIMSGADGFAFHLTGAGGHGAMASAEGNVVLAVSHLAPRLPGLVENFHYEGVACACSAGVVQAGTANNVVPRHAAVHGTLRTFTEQQRSDGRASLLALAHETESLVGVEVDLRFTGHTACVKNDPNVNESVEASARRVVGDDMVWRIPPASPSDDMSVFLSEVPGAYIFIGGAMADGSSGMHHSPDFAIDDAALPVFARVLATAAVDLAQPMRN